MSNGQDYYLPAVKVVKRNVSALPELHHPLTKLWQHVFDRTTDLGMFAKLFNTAPDQFDRTLGGVSTLRCKKGMQTSYIEQGRLRPD